MGIRESREEKVWRGPKCQAVFRLYPTVTRLLRKSLNETESWWGRGRRLTFIEY